MRDVWLLAATQALCASGTVIIVLLGGILGTELAPDPSWATLPVSMAILGLALTTIPAALLMQRIGRKRVFMLSAGMAGLASIAVAWAVSRHDFTLFCGAIVLMGANLAVVAQYRFAAVEFVPPARAARAIVIVMLGTLAATLVAPPIALAARHLLPIEYVGSFLAATLLYALAVVLLAFLSPPPARHVQPTEPARPLREIVRQPTFFVAVLAGVSAFAVMSFIMTATPIAMHVVDEHSVDVTAWVIQGHLLGMYLPSLVSGWLVTRIGIRRMMALGVFLMAACIVISALGTHHVMHYWWALVLLGAGWNLLFIAGTTLLTTSYRPSERFKAQAVNEFAVFGSQAVASLLAGTAMHYLGWSNLNLVGAPVLVAMLLGLYALHRVQRAPAAAAGALSR